jgi:hypothetical protein
LGAGAVFHNVTSSASNQRFSDLNQIFKREQRGQIIKPRLAEMDPQI